MPTGKKKTLNTFVLKHVVDEATNTSGKGKGGLSLIGTFVQIVYDLPQERVDEEFAFGYRFNEVSPTGTQLLKRRTQPVRLVDDKKAEPTVVLGTRTTFQASVPLLIEPLLQPSSNPRSVFPFELCLATATIELSSNEFYRPDLLIENTNRRVVVNLQNLLPKDTTIEERIGLNRNPTVATRLLRKLLGWNEHRSKLKQVLAKIDRSKSYEFLSPHPTVRFHYDTKKEYCPRFHLGFYVVPKQKMVWMKFVAPLFLVAGLAGVNSFSDLVDDDADGGTMRSSNADRFRITAILTLAVVVVVPQTLQGGQRTKSPSSSTSKNVFLTAYFAGLLLSGLPKAVVGTVIPELVGVGLMASCLVWVVHNAIVYNGVRRTIYRAALAQQASEKHRYLKSTGYEKVDYSTLKTLGELLSIDNEVTPDPYLYGTTDGGRYKYLEWKLPDRQGAGPARIIIDAVPSGSTRVELNAKPPPPQQQQQSPIRGNRQDEPGASEGIRGDAPSKGPNKDGARDAWQVVFDKVQNETTTDVEEC